MISPILWLVLLAVSSICPTESIWTYQRYVLFSAMTSIVIVTVLRLCLCIGCMFYVHALYTQYESVASLIMTQLPLPTVFCVKAEYLKEKLTSGIICYL